MRTTARILGAAIRAGLFAIFGKWLLIGGALAAVFLLVFVLSIIPISNPSQARADCSDQGMQISPVGAPIAPGNRLAEQIQNAKTIATVAQNLGLSGPASRIGIIAAAGESTLINIGFGDAAGPDSAGLFQQRSSAGWGTREQVMNPAYAATSFFIGPARDRARGLLSVAGWESMEPSLAINKVQANANPMHYVGSYALADEIIRRAGIDITRIGAGGTSNKGISSAGCQIRAGTAGDGTDDYPWKSLTPGPETEIPDPLGYFYGECTSFAAWRLNRDAKSTTAPFTYSAANGFAFGNATTWRSAWQTRSWRVSSTPIPGALAWWSGNGGAGIGPAGHIAYVLEVQADGKIVIDEYNNSGLAPPGHRYSKRAAADPSTVGAFLYPPGK